MSFWHVIMLKTFLGLYLLLTSSVLNFNIFYILHIIIDFERVLAQFNTYKGWSKSFYSKAVQSRFGMPAMQNLSGKTSVFNRYCWSFKDFSRELKVWRSHEDEHPLYSPDLSVSDFSIFYVTNLWYGDLHYHEAEFFRFAAALDVSL